MATIYKLTGVHTENSNLPKLGDYGMLDPNGLTTLLKIKSASYPNEGDARGALSYIGTGTGAAAPSYADGVITCQETAFAAGQWHQWAVPGNITSASYTVAMLIKLEPVSTANNRSMYFYRHEGGAGVNLYYNPYTAGISALIYNGADKKATIYPAAKAGEWLSLCMTVRPDGFAGIHNESEPLTFTFASLGGVPNVSAAGKPLLIGGTTPQASFAGQIGGILRFDRAMSDDELRSLARAMRVFAARKGISV